MLERGTEGAQQALDPCLDRIRKEADGDTIVIGGPPCQAYSLVGRARNRGIKNYDPATDHRHFLYREYTRILGRFQPIAFVMENVKGMLRSEEHTSELQSLMRNSYAVFGLTKKINKI